MVCVCASVCAQCACACIEIISCVFQLISRKLISKRKFKWNTNTKVSGEWKTNEKAKIPFFQSLPGRELAFSLGTQISLNMRNERQQAMSERLRPWFVLSREKEHWKEKHIIYNELVMMIKLVMQFRANHCIHISIFLEMNGTRCKSAAFAAAAAGKKKQRKVYLECGKCAQNSGITRKKMCILTNWIGSDRIGREQLLLTLCT